MSKPTKKTELRPAWNWTCDSCGRENFIHIIEADLRGDDRVEVARALGIIDEDEDHVPPGIMFSRPEFVTCDYCEAKFQAHDMEDEDDFYN